MKKRMLAAITALCLALSLASCSGGDNGGGESGDKNLEKVTILLEWTPNTNHTGLYEMCIRDRTYTRSGASPEIQRVFSCSLICEPICLMMVTSGYFFLKPSICSFQKVSP